MSRSLIPNSTQIPDVILDHWMAHLSGAEFKVVLYVARRTFGFGKESDTISINQISRGIRTRHGVQLDYGTGLSRSSVKSACASLATRGILIKTQAMVGGTDEPDENTYRLNLYAPILLEEDSRPVDDSSEESDFEVGQKLAHVGQKSSHPQNRPGVGQKLAQGRPEIRREVGQKLAPQETDQETDLQETAAERLTVRPTRRHVTKGTAAVLTLEVLEPLTPEAEVLTRDLKAAGLNVADAERFAQIKPEEARRQLQYLAFKADLENPGAYLRAAIEGGYAPPKEYLQAKRKDEQERKKRETAERKAAAEALRMAQEAEKAREVDESLSQLEKAQPEAFAAFLAYIEKHRGELEIRYQRMPATIRAKMLASLETLEKRRELFVAWQTERSDLTP